jgi:hypothetical protein
VIGGLPPQFGGARLLKDRRFHQGNRRTLTDLLGYIEECADLSDIALVCLVESVGRRSDIGVVTQRETTARHDFSSSIGHYRKKPIALRKRWAVLEPRPTNH